MNSHTLVDRILSNNQVVAVLDVGWGDSGKGKVVDFLSSKLNGHNPFFPVVYRANGGPNTGHTIDTGTVRYVSHLIPSGAHLPEVLALIGPAVVFEPRTFFAELQEVFKINPDAKVYVDGSTHVIMPWHIALDNLREAIASEGKIGTTGRGVGPCMETKCSRNGFITVEMLLPENVGKLEDAIEEAITRANPELDYLAELFRVRHGDVANYFRSINLPFGITLADFFDESIINVDAVVQAYKIYGQTLASHVNHCVPLLRHIIGRGERVLVEGAQGALLDLTHGTYPYVTAGFTTKGGLEHDAGIPIDAVFYVAKAYATRVGGGPFPTELDGDLGEKLRKAGNEYGSTTGRPRRVGWFDAVATRYGLDLSARVRKDRIVVLTKLDVLSGMKPRICDSHKIQGLGETRDYVPGLIEKVSMGHAIGFDTIENLDGVSTYGDLPANARTYVDSVGALCDANIVMVGNGAARNRVILRAA